MYCIKCGVQLADTEKKCPLCATVVYHPEIEPEDALPLYPPDRFPAPYAGSKAVQIVLSAFCLLAICITLLCDLQINGSVTWSGYVFGSLIIAYTALVLPYWFRRPNPVVFLPIVFAATGLNLLYINHVTEGDWFLSFALPVTGGIGLITTAATALLRYVRRGKLYILGGVMIVFGAFMLLLEFLICMTFSAVRFVGWSLYPLVAFVIIGGMLIVLAVSNSAREIVKRKTFI